MSLRYLAGLLEFSPSYMSDIENGNRAAPLKYLEEMIRILKVEKDEINYFYDLAGCSHGYWPDLNEYLGENPHARKFLRYVMANNIPAEIWTSIVINYKKDEDCEELEK